ncbi:MAG: Helicase PriA essential for oriC/DnaA-independent DNA replication, partial [uncultured Sphingomonadaceae bacterium]
VPRPCPPAQCRAGPARLPRAPR